MLLTWVVCLGMISFITTSWYLTQPLIARMISASQTFVTSQNLKADLQTRSINFYTLLGWLNYWWAPVLVLMFLLWAFISSQAKDVESDIYG